MECCSTKRKENSSQGNGSSLIEIRDRHNVFSADMLHPREHNVKLNLPSNANAKSATAAGTVINKESTQEFDKFVQSLRNQVVASVATAVE